MASNLIIGSSSEVSDEARRLRAHYNDQWEENTTTTTTGGFSEIEEEESPAVANSDHELNNKIIHHLGTIREEAAFEDVVYVAVGKQGGGDDEAQASMGALMWALKNNNPTAASTFVFLVHVFPETKFIPTPLGNLPISQVNREQREKHMAQQEDKRRNFLHRFLKACSDSEVKADTILIESEMEAKAILDLIPILNIRNLVLGATKSTLKRVMRSRKGTGVVDEIVKNAPEFCEIKIICEGKEMSERMLESSSSSSPSSSYSPSQRATNGFTPRYGHGQGREEETRIDSASCGCFKL